MLVIGSKQYINHWYEIISKNKTINYNEDGKPYFENSLTFFSKSHTKKLSVMYVDNNNCGIDIEYIRKYNDRIGTKVCSKEELIFLTNTENKDYYFTLLWVLKEAYYKCLGIGIFYNPKETSFIKDNKLNISLTNYQFNVINYFDYIIVICKKTQKK